MMTMINATIHAVKFFNSRIADCLALGETGLARAYAHALKGDSDAIADRLTGLCSTPSFVRDATDGIQVLNALRAEAAEAGDAEMAQLCTVALLGDAAAIRHCFAVVSAVVSDAAARE